MPKLDAGDTIQLGDNITYNNGPLVFNSGISLTLDLNEKTLNSTDNNNDGIHVGHGSSKSAYPKGLTTSDYSSLYEGVTKGNNLTIIGNGTISSKKNAIRLHGAEHEYPNLDSSEYSKLTVGRKGGSDAINITGDKRGIAGLANANYFNVEINTTGTITGTEHGIYNPQVGNLTINSGTISATGTTNNEGTAVEFSSGVLEINGGTITSKSSNKGVTFTKNIGGGLGASSYTGLAIVQHQSGKSITVNINDGDISGNAALALANTNNIGNFGDDNNKLSSSSPAFYGEVRLDENGNKVIREFEGKQLYIATDKDGKAISYYHNKSGDYEQGSTVYVTYSGDTAEYYELATRTEFAKITDQTELDNLSTSVNAEKTKANPVYERVNGTIEVNVNGGKLTSTSTATTENASKKASEKGDIYTITGRNAIVNFDNRVTVNLKETEVDGNLAASQRTTTGEDPDVKSFNILSDNKFSGFEDGVTNEDTFVARTVSDATSSYTAEIMGAKGWDATTTNNFVYYKDTLTSSAIATLAPSTEENETTTVLKLTTAGSESETVALDLTETQFNKASNLADTFSTLDASGAIATFALDITGNEKFKAIIGGAGNDTITAPSVGAALDGGQGNDYLIGGAGNDTFIFSGGSDTIQDYVYGKDAVSLGASFVLPTSFDSIDNSDSSNFVLAVGSSASLTFRPIAELQIAQNGDTYSYTAKSIALDKEGSHGISLGAGWTSDFNGTKEAYENYATIDAAKVTKTIKITGNDKANYIVGGTGGGTLLGGDNKDTLVAGGGSTTLNGGAGDDLLIGSSTGYNYFIYSEGSDSISGYHNADVINVTGRAVSFADVSVSAVGADKNNKTDLLIKFDDENQLSIAGGASAEAIPISIKSGRNNYEFTKNYFALNGKSITLTSSYDDGKSAGYQTYNGASTTYQTINAGLVTGDISIVGNTLDNYIVGGLSGNSLSGGDGDDTLVGGTVSTVADLFYYTAGQDVIENFDESKDKLAIEDTLVAGITSGKLTNSRLTFTFDKKNDLTFKFGDNEPFESVSLNGGEGYLTKDGVVSIPSSGTSSLDLFGSAKGRIDLTETLYRGAGIASVNAVNVKNQTVTLVGGTQGGTFAYATNKKRDGFEYGDGNVSISGYEGGRDRIDLNGVASLSSFTVDTGGVKLTLGNKKTISIAGAKDQEVLLRDAGSRGYKKMVFAATGVVQNKKSNPTMVTVSSGATEYSAANTPTVKKIFVTDIAKATSIQAGNRSNTIIDASKAANTVSLSGGNKNDKLIGNASYADTFIYGAGKDVVQGFHSGDSISLSSEQSAKLESAKITASKKSIKFKFGNKDVLTIKSNDTMSGALNINGEEKIYFKNAIGDLTDSVSLTSGFSGTFRTQDSKRTALPTATVVNGSKVEKNLTFVGSSANETLIGGKKKKTMFKGGGGDDSLVGGSGKDTFFYAKGNEGNAIIAKFDFANDKLKVASGIIGNIEQSGNTITFGMTKGKSTDAVVGSFNIKSDKEGKDITPSKVAIKANNTLYWFASNDDASRYVSVDDGSAITPGTLITTENRISNVSAIPINGDDVSSVIDLNYSTNLAKSGVAIKVKSKTTT